MRIHPLCLLFFTIPAIVTALPTNTCFNYGTEKETLRIKDCELPLILNKNEFNSVPKNITQLVIHNVRIDKIEKNAFEGFQDLSTIIIKNSHINELHPEAFLLPELDQLNIQKTIFKQPLKFSADYLEELILKDCYLNEIPNLDDLPALSFLNLANNNIKKIDDSTFAKHAGLEELQISNNSLSEITPKAFQNNVDMVTLNLDHNPIDKLNFKFPENLEMLSLKNCHLTTFNANNAKQLALVQTLLLNGNDISILPIDTFEPMKDLESIDLSGNKLVELDDDIFLENKNLDTIVLDNNPFEKLPNFNITDNKVTSFSCKNCGLRTVKKAFDLLHIVKLDLSENHLKDMSEILKIAGLKNLNVASNEISILEIQSDGGKIGVEILNLANNPLVPLDPVAFDLMPSLKELNVTSSNLETLWSNHNSNLPSVENLSVGKNKLSKLTVEDLKVTPALKVLDFEMNPLSCLDSKFKRYLLEKSISTVLFKPQYSTNILPPDCDNADDDDLSDSYEDFTELYDNDITNYDDTVEASIVDSNVFNLSNASYVLGITSVFIVTALLVLFVAVVITLLILKKNKSFSQSNLPRFKIPLWYNNPGQKKHSGSVYRPLSEEFGSTISQYHFTQTPQVHTALP